MGNPPVVDTIGGIWACLLFPLVCKLHAFTGHCYTQLGGGISCEFIHASSMYVQPLGKGLPASLESPTRSGCSEGVTLRGAGDPEGATEGGLRGRGKETSGCKYLHHRGGDGGQADGVHPRPHGESDRAGLGPHICPVCFGIHGPDCAAVLSLCPPTSVLGSQDGPQGGWEAGLAWVICKSSPRAEIW